MKTGKFRKAVPAALLWVAVAGAFAMLPGARVWGEEPLIQRPVVAPPKFGDSVIDKALAKAAEKSELAQVQEKPLKELAEKTMHETAQKKESAVLTVVERDRLAGEIVALLYQDQAAAFREAVENQKDPADVIPGKWAQSRTWTLLGNTAIEPETREKIQAALTECYRGIYPAQAALEAEYRDRLSDPKIAEEYRAKLEALLKPVCQKTLELARGFLSPDKQKEIDAERDRRQERKIQVLFKSLRAEINPQTAAGRKKFEALLAAFRDTAKTLDMDSSDYNVLVEKLRSDASGLP
jgi:hypothetical protein